MDVTTISRFAAELISDAPLILRMMTEEILSGAVGGKVMTTPSAPFADFAQPFDRRFRNYAFARWTDVKEVIAAFAGDIIVARITLTRNFIFRYSVFTV
jgi:hypothetical protein